MKRLIAFALALLVINLVLVSTASATNEAEKIAKRAEKVKRDVTKLGVGKAARIEIKLSNGTKVKGYVSEIKDTSFVVVDAAGMATEIPYPDAKQVHGNNLTTGQKILIGVGAALVVLLVIGLTSWD